MAHLQDSVISATDGNQLQTQVLSVDISKVGATKFDPHCPGVNADTFNLMKAARHLRETAIPVAFPTETVYGLGADATRSDAVRGIYKAKQRPNDNPLIVHICSLAQLRSLLQPQPEANGYTNGFHDPLPEIYHPLIQRFWPGPLTILLPNPLHSILAPEVTAGLPTFGARMPSSPLALALIELAGVPLAAPSANASTKPSPTTAQHVKHDLDGRIEIILDGGPCDVGVESTVVDGLSDPPLILRPGGVSIEQLRECPGWENTVIGYKDGSEAGKAPRAPGMKYKHYSPKAKVVLMEGGTRSAQLDEALVQRYIDEGLRIVGVIRTKHWKALDFQWKRSPQEYFPHGNATASNGHTAFAFHSFGTFGSLYPPNGGPFSTNNTSANPHDLVLIHDVSLGPSTAEIARGLFSALRELDLKGVDVIFVEGIDDGAGEGAAAVMNRLRKAAEVVIQGRWEEGESGIRRREM